MEKINLKAQKSRFILTVGNNPRFSAEEDMIRPWFLRLLWWIISYPALQSCGMWVC